MAEGEERDNVRAEVRTLLYKPEKNYRGRPSTSFSPRSERHYTLCGARKTCNTYPSLPTAVWIRQSKLQQSVSHIRARRINYPAKCDHFFALISTTQPRASMSADPSRAPHHVRALIPDCNRDDYDAICATMCRHHAWDFSFATIPRLSNITRQRRESRGALGISAHSDISHTSSTKMSCATGRTMATVV